VPRTPDHAAREDRLGHARIDQARQHVAAPADLFARGIERIGKDEKEGRERQHHRKSWNRFGDAVDEIREPLAELW
jgi:hypothetical protein